MLILNVGLVIICIVNIIFYVWVSLCRVLSGWCLVVMYLRCGMSFGVKYLDVGSGCIDRDCLYHDTYEYVVHRKVRCVFICSFFFPSFFVYPPWFLFLFPEFISGVCGLRWLCRGGIVAYYVECTNVVKRWHGSDCVNQGYQGCRGWFSKLT